MNEIKSVIFQLERQRASIDRALEALREIEGNTEPAAKKRGPAPGKKRGKKRRMSAEGRARIGEATRKRWAEKRSAEAATSKRPRKKRAPKKAIAME